MSTVVGVDCRDVVAKFEVDRNSFHKFLVWTAKRGLRESRSRGASLILWANLYYFVVLVYIYPEMQGVKFDVAFRTRDL